MHHRTRFGERGLGAGLMMLLVLTTLLTCPFFPGSAAQGPPSTQGRDSRDAGKWSEDFNVTGTKGAFERTMLVDGKVVLDTDVLHWTKYPGNPVLTANPGKFDDRGPRCNFVIYEDGLFKMWYGGYDGTYFQMGYATSSDGINWTRQNNGNPVLRVGPDGAWDDTWITQLYALKEGNTYRMYYSGNDGAIGRIGFATSTDGLNWTKYHSNPVFEADDSGFDSVHVGVDTLLKEGNEYKMWYYGNAGSSYVNAVGYATSADGISWSRRPDPVLGKGEYDKFDSGGSENAYVMKYNGRYLMIYTGSQDSTQSIGAADSPDGITWTRLNDGDPVLSHGAGNEWDNGALYEHSVLKVKNRWYLWYGGGGVDCVRKFGYTCSIGLAMADYYREGFLTSERILLPLGQRWDTISYEGGTPPGTDLTLSVLDDAGPIPGYEDLHNRTINISGLPRRVTDITPAIQLRVKFTSNGSATPWLDGWDVSWKSFQVPVVNITSPEDEALLEAGPFNMTGTVRFQGGGTLERLEWRVDGGAWTGIVPPALDWNATVPLLSAGKHILEVKATSTGGLTGSDSILVVVKYPQKMLCVITFPREGQEVAGLTPVRGVAFDPAGLITTGKLDLGPKSTGFNIQFNRWGIKYNMSVLPGGRTVLKASITNNVGQQAWDTVNITVIPPPKVTILFPTDGQRIKDNSFVLNVKFEHPGTTALHVDVLMNGVKVSTTDVVPGVVTLTLDSPENRGNFTVTVKARDQWGQVGEDTNIPYRYIKPKPYKTWVIPFPWWVVVIICVCCAADVIYRYVTRKDLPEMGPGLPNERAYYK